MMSVPRFLPKWLGGEADRVDGEGVRLPVRPVAPAARTGLTDDPTDPRLGYGFVRPVRRSYRHEACGAMTTMGQALAETYARQPSFYSATYCVTCRMHKPVGENGEFVWIESDGSVSDQKVGT
jgi:hypothetical protein